MTQKEFNKRLNMTNQSIYSHEKGDNEPSLDPLVKLADILHECGLSIM